MDTSPCLECGNSDQKELRMLRSCRHVYCVSCLAGYLQSNQVQTGETFQCATTGCQHMEDMPKGGAARLSPVTSAVKHAAETNLARISAIGAQMTGGSGNGKQDQFSMGSSDTQNQPSEGNRNNHIHAASWSGNDDKSGVNGAGAGASADAEGTGNKGGDKSDDGDNSTTPMDVDDDGNRDNKNISYHGYRNSQSDQHHRHDNRNTHDTSVLPKKQRSRGKFDLKEIKADLFTSPQDYSLANCISADVNMGKGIITAFKKHFGGQREIINQGIGPGGVAVLKRGQRYVYYLVTKQRYFEKPTETMFQASLLRMCQHCVEHDVHHLAMPRIGCGLDGFKWPQVKQMIIDIFGETDICIYIYH